MGVACRLSDDEWLYYCVFVQMALDLHRNSPWEAVEPLLAAAWAQGRCSADWHDVACMLHTHWRRGAGMSRADAACGRVARAVEWTAVAARRDLRLAPALRPAGIVSP